MVGFGPADIGTVLQGVGAIAQAAAIGFAAWLASNTFGSWRRQTIVTRRMDQAERILTATHKVRRGLTYVRNPMLWGHELQAAEDDLKAQGKLTGSESDKKKLTTAHLYFRRLNAELDKRLALEDCLPMARALFGETVEKAMDELNRQFHYVSVAVDMQYRFDEHTERAFREEIEAKLWGGTPTPAENKMDLEIAALVKTIEDACVPEFRLEK